MAYTFRKPNSGAAAAPAAAPASAPAAAPAAHPLPPPTAPPVAAAPIAATPAPVQAAAPVAAAPAAVAPPVTRRRAGRPPASAVNPPVAPPVAAAPAVVAAPAPVQQVITAPVQQNVVAHAQPTRPGFLALLAPKAGQQTVGQRIAEKAAESFGEPNEFPTLVLKDGQGGGTYKLDVMNPEGSDVDLPTDSKPMVVVLLGYCHRMMIWNREYKPGNVEAPRKRATIPNTEVEAGDLFMDAFKNCNFIGKPNKYIFDGDSADKGHVSGSIDLLCFYPTAGFIGIRSAHTYNSMTRTTEEVIGAFADEPTPVCISIEKEPIKTKNSTYDSFYLRIEQRNDAEAMAAFAKFSEYVAAAGNDPDLMAAVEAWQKNSMTPEIIATMQSIKDIQ